MKYPVGIQTFQDIINGGYVYVDKTDLIYSLVSEGKIYFLSRPRRFGKSLLISTLENYFLGKKELFKGLAIEKLETEWKEYPVFHLDFNSDDFKEKDALNSSLDYFVSEGERKYGVEKIADLGLGRRFARVLSAAHEQTGLKCVVLIDEYDKPLLDVLGSGLMTEVDGNRVALEERNRDIMKAFYSTLKLADEDLQFVFLTGVTKFAKVSVFSGFNQPMDISLSPKYDTLCGITMQEEEQYFQTSVAELAMAEDITVDEMRAKLRRRYDGYNFSRRLRGVYNPFCLLNAFALGNVENYWYSSATPTYLVNLLDRDNVNLNELAGKYYDASDFMDFKMDQDAPLPMFYQSGYLTIKGYDAKRELYLLDVPNQEVQKSFIPLLADDYFQTKKLTRPWIVSISDELEEGNLESFRQKLTSFFASIPYNLRTKQTSERYFHCAFYLIMRMVSTFHIYTEKCQSQGRVDCVIETDKFIYIFEFKLDGTAEEALQQIEEKGYAREYASDTRKLYKIGCSFSSETGTIGEWMVKE